MALPVFRRFSQQDVPTAPNWIAAIFNPLNVFCEQTVQALNKNLTIGENVQGQKFSTSFTTLPDASFLPINFNYTGGGQPNCCLIGQISRPDGIPIVNSTTITSWTLNINTRPALVTITAIGNLVPNTKYNLTVVVL